MQNWHWKLNVASYFIEIEHTICQHVSLCFNFGENIPWLIYAEFVQQHGQMLEMLKAHFYNAVCVRAK